MRLGLSGTCALLAVACGGGAQQGGARAPLEWSEALPSGYESLGMARASCGAIQPGQGVHEAPATSFACSRHALERALLEQARERGATVLAEKHCHRVGERGLACSARLARAAPDTASVRELARGGADALTEDLDALAASVAEHIVIDLETATERVAGRARPAADVAEFRLMPVGQVAVGVVRARCQVGACSQREARRALRLAAGGLGVPGLVGVGCAALEGEVSCTGTLATWEVDPERDARAR